MAGSQRYFLRYLLIILLAGTLTVSQMLSYAVSQSKAGGSLWYENVKVTEEKAKDAFDTINNQKAFSVQFRWLVEWVVREIP